MRNWSVLERYNVPVGAVRAASDRGEIVLWFAAPTVLLQVARGHGDAALGESFMKEQERLFAGRRDVTSFFDGWLFTGYDTPFRASLSAYAKKQVDAGLLKDVVLLTRSKIVAMGAAVVNLVLDSKIEVLGKVNDFDARLVKLGGSAALKSAAKP